MIIIVMILISNNMMPILNPSDLYLAYESCQPLLTSGDSIRNALAKEKLSKILRQNGVLNARHL